MLTAHTDVHPEVSSLEASSETTATLADPRFCRLLGQEAWAALPVATRARFGRHIGPGQTAAYIGQIDYTRMNRAGQTLAWLLQLIGSPLPLDTDNAGEPALVSVTEDMLGRGQFWVRQYGRTQGRFPQTVQSTKRFAGPTGCEEWISRRIGMSLHVQAEDDILLFKSAHYYIRLLGRRLSLPNWLSPGQLVVGHCDMGESQFRFTLRLTHPWFGTLLDQSILFRDVA